MAWATGARAGAQSGIKSLAEGVNAGCRLVMTECVAPGAGWMGDAAIRGWLMLLIRNQGRSKRGGEIRHPEDGRDPRTEWFT